MSEQPSDVRSKILIAEGDTIVSLDLQGMIMRMGYDVVALVDSGAEAIAAVKRFLPDIVLLGTALNGPMDGIQAARGIHETSDIPVVFCLTNADLPTLVRAKEVSYAGYLLKPINPDSLATTLDTVLYKSKLEKRVRRAEEKSRELERFGAIFSGLAERRACFDWAWTAESGLSFSGGEPSEALRSIAPRLETFAASCANLSLASLSSSCLIENISGDGTRSSFAVLALRDGSSVSGMAIQLSRAESECPRT
jgi:DNA-binding NarL/FixJ family response regulator